MLLKEIHQIEIAVPGLFSFNLTVAKPAGWHWATPKEIFESDTLWSGTYTSDKPAGLKLFAEKQAVKAIIYAQPEFTTTELSALPEE